MPKLIDQKDQLAVVEPTEDADEQLLQVAKAAVKRAGESSWEAADAFLELSNRGWTQQRIADECGVSQGGVSRFIACAKKYALAHDRPPFWEAYRKVGGHATAKEDESAAAPTSDVAKLKRLIELDNCLYNGPRGLEPFAEEHHVRKSTVNGDLDTLRAMGQAIRTYDVNVDDELKTCAVYEEGVEPLFYCNRRDAKVSPPTALPV